MRIAAYVEQAYHSSGGNSVYETELVRHLGRVDDQHQYTLFTSRTYRDAPDLDVDGNPRFQRRSLTLPHALCHGLWLLADWPPVDAALGKHDLYHALNPIVFPAREGRYLVTIHDLFTLTVPDFVGRRHRLGWQVHVKRMLRRADHFVAVSESTRHDMIAHLNVASDRITVVHEGVRPGFEVLAPDAVREIRQRYGLTHPYFMVSESRNPRKNVLRMLRAFAVVRRRSPDPVELVMTSPGSTISPAATDEIARAGLEAAVRFCPHVCDADLVALMNGATALLFVSLYEGFGLPILEAMACDTPVVTANVSSMPEVAGDAAVLVDPTDEEAIAEAMWELLTDEGARRQRVEAGRRRVQKFTWERMARQYVTLYDSLV